MATRGYFTWNFLLGMALVLDSVWIVSSRRARYSVNKGFRINADLHQVAFFSAPKMTSIKCAAFCCLNSECGHFHFSNVNNSCYIFKEEVWFTPSRDLTADPNWTTGTLLNGLIRRGSWFLVFRGQGRIGVSVKETWYDSSQQDDKPWRDDFPQACLRITDYSQCDRHFRSHILDSWTNIGEVHFTLVKDDVEVAYILFDGTGSNMSSWINKNRIISSTWSPALDNDPDIHEPRISGHCGHDSCRQFRFYGSYGFCYTDFLYTLTIDKVQDVCNEYGQWKPQDLNTFPVFYYSNGPGRGSLGLDQESLGYYEAEEADVMAVWVKFL